MQMKQQRFQNYNFVMGRADLGHADAPEVNMAQKAAG
jgi:hypothetical protein